MFALTIDQQRSTSRGDQVPDLLATLTPLTKSLEGITFPFERTVGDEVQAATTSAASAFALIRAVMRVGGWTIGLGIGTLTTPEAPSSRAASGTAFLHARTSVERAKTKSTAVALAVHGDNEAAAQDSEAILQLLGAMITRRSAQGWEVVDALSPYPSPHRSPHPTSSGSNVAPAPSQQEIGDMLGITRQAVNKRLKTALWAEELAAIPLAIALLERADA